MPIENAYRKDLAYIHDAGYRAVAREAARRLLQELGSCGRRHGAVVDLGCGSGILAQYVLEAGYSVIGIDTSDAMVAMARRRAREAQFRVSSFVSAALPRCVAVTAIGEVLNYSVDSANDDHARTDLFRRVYTALMPGGLWLFDIAGPGRVKPGDADRTFAQGPDWAVLVETHLDAATAVLTRKITSFRKLGDAYRRDSEVHRLTLIDPAAVQDSLNGIGFEVNVIPNYGGSPLPRGVVAFLARKPGNHA